MSTSSDKCESKLDCMEMKWLKDVVEQVVVMRGASQSVGCLCAASVAYELVRYRQEAMKAAIRTPRRGYTVSM